MSLYLYYNRVNSPYLVSVVPAAKIQFNPINDSKSTALLVKNQITDKDLNNVYLPHAYSTQKHRFFIQWFHLSLFYHSFMHHMLMLLKLLSFPSIILMHVILESSLNHVLGHCAM